MSRERSTYSRENVSHRKKAPDFKAVNGELAEVSLSDYRGKRVILNIFPSLDTPTCAVSVRQFNARASSLDNTVVLCLSMDLPFAQSRFCSVEGLETSYRFHCSEITVSSTNTVSN